MKIGKGLELETAPGLSEAETEYIGKALVAGTMPKQDIVIVVCLSKVTGKSCDEIQSAYMDASIGFQNVFRGLAGKGLQP